MLRRMQILPMVLSFTVLALVLVPGGASAQPPRTLRAAAEQAAAMGVPAAPVEELVRRWEERGYPATAGLAVLATITGAVREDLPASPLLQKAMEGLAKGVPPERIAAVVDQRAGTLREANQLLVTGAPDLMHAEANHRALQALADALFQGAARDDLERVVRQAAEGRGAEGVRWVEAVSDAVAGMIASGVRSAEAADLAMLRLARAGSPEEVRHLAGEALALRRAGVSPSQLVERLRGGVERQTPPSLGPPAGRSPDRPHRPPGPSPRPPLRLPAR